MLILIHRLVFNELQRTTEILELLNLKTIEPRGSCFTYPRTAAAAAAASRFETRAKFTF